MQSSYNEGRRLMGLKKGRKNFSSPTKKRVWMRAGGHNPNDWKKATKYTSKCMSSECKHKQMILRWGDKTYDWDHYDNNHANNAESNCYLVHTFCHRKATQFGSRTKTAYGLTIGKERTKLKASYKAKLKGKHRSKGSKKAKPKNFWSEVP